MLNLACWDSQASLGTTCSFMVAVVSRSSNRWTAEKNWPHELQYSDERPVSSLVSISFETKRLFPLSIRGNYLRSFWRTSGTSGRGERSDRIGCISSSSLFSSAAASCSPIRFRAAVMHRNYFIPDSCIQCTAPYPYRCGFYPHKLHAPTYYVLSPLLICLAVNQNFSGFFFQQFF